jgi:hypothetical protein
MRTGSSVGQVFCKSQGISSRIRGLEKASSQFGIQIAPRKPAIPAQLRTILEHCRDTLLTFYLSAFDPLSQLQFPE